jgi:small subunit ribosomal protein S1
MEIQTNDLEKFYANTFRGLKVGEITRGKVIQVKSDGVIVDVGAKSEGFVPAKELVGNELESLSPGDEIDVYVEKLSDSDGFVKLSRQKAEGLKSWDMIEEAYHESKAVDGTITGKVKGGLTVNIGGVNAFLPGSQVDLRTPRNPESLIGQTFSFRILNLNHRGSNVVVSRRVILEEERRILKEKTVEKLTEGAIVEGTVKNLTDYGAFIDLGGIDGLLHISDMSWGRINHPSELFNVGDKVEVKVLNFDPEKEKVTLGYKQKTPDPWTTVEEKYPIGARVIGKVITLTDYGIFVELEEGIEGLVHVSEIDWIEKNIKPSKYFSVGDSIEAMVLKVNKEDKKISLSIRKLKPNPWDLVRDKYSPGMKIRGKIKSLTEFGAFISLQEGVDALLHVSDISWTKKIRHPADVLKKGDEIEVMVVKVEPDNERISVSLKDMTEDPWKREIPEKYGLGDTVNGKVSGITDFGVFVELEDGVEGLMHISEVERKPDEKLEDIFKMGDEVSVRIVNINPEERKLDLSMKSMIG